MRGRSVGDRRVSSGLPGFKLQPRDERVVRFVGVHGQASMPLVKSFAFEERDGRGDRKTVSDQAVYRRLKRLCDVGFLEHTRTWYGDHGVYRATKAGVALAGLDVAPARLDKRDYEHDLRVVRLALGIAERDGDNWITERQIRSRLRPGASIGRVPDGLILGPGGERWAVELEISGKEAQRYEDACARYADRHRDRIPDGSTDWDSEEQLDDYVGGGGQIDGVVWYFFSDAKLRRALAAAERVLTRRRSAYADTDHLCFRFHGADPPKPPPFRKHEEQERCERREAERLARWRQEEAECQETQRRRAEALEVAGDYLTPAEQQEAVRDAQRSKHQQGRGLHLTADEHAQALIDAASNKYAREQEKERRRRQTRNSIKQFFGRDRETGR